MIGQTVAHYQILEKLGEGGMGVVYRARDTKLDRDVALKFLPAHLAASDADKARFVQEAKSAAALSHPNVCSVFDIQEQEIPMDPGGAGAGMAGGKRMFIVMEYIDGVTLRVKMEGAGGASQQPYPLKQAVELGIQIADGLSAAHEKGIVHRDVKPENIMVRRDGIIQIMDFGLAKLRGKASRITMAGSTVGTAGYMSPEQVQGSDADHRSDIFSLGVLLYELLTGRLPFRGVHETALMYEIVNVEPEPMSAVNPALDPELDRIVYECLQKDPEERYQSVKDVSRDLKRFRRESSKARMSRTFAARPGGIAAGGPSSGSHETARSSSVREAGTSESVRPPGRSIRSILLPAAAFIAGAAVIAFIWRPWSPPEELRRPVTRLTFTLPDSMRIPIGTMGINISPDGRFISVLVQDGTNLKIMLRPAERENFELVQGSTVVSGPVYYTSFSPDCQWMAFTSVNAIKKVSVYGGASSLLTEAVGQPRGLWWGADGNIYFGVISGPIHRVGVNGDNPEPVTSLDSVAGEISHRFPELLPDGSILYTVKYNNITSFDEAAIGVFTPSTGRRKILMRGGSSGRYLPTGHLLYTRSGEMHAAPFDVGKLEVTGPPKKLFPGGWMNPFSGDISLAFSNDGTLLYVPRGIRSYSVGFIKWIDMKGQVSPLVDTSNAYFIGAISPDGQKLAVHVQAANDDIWIYHLGRKSFSRLTFGGGNSGFPVWTPDSKSLIFSSERSGPSNLYRKPWDGSGEMERLTTSPRAQNPRSVSNDGRTLAFIQEGDIWTLPLDGERKPAPFLTSSATEDNPVFSPDDRYLAYESNESGRSEIYVVPYPSKAGKWQISSGGGAGPLWSPAGTEVYYFEGSAVFAVEIRTAGGFDYSAPRKLFTLPPDALGISDISPDGRRFVAVTLPTDDLSANEVTMVKEWFSEVEAAFGGQ